LQNSKKGANFIYALTLLLLTGYKMCQGLEFSSTILAGTEKQSYQFAVHVTLHRKHSEGKEQLDAQKYAVLLPQHVSGTNMPIIRSTINK
jgi:hypothetical protein